jgi:SAM-dependent methyltransferase
MDCCSTPTRQSLKDVGGQGTNKFFSRWSKTYVKRFRRKGLAKEQRYLVEGITQEPLASKTILDIGSGVGSLHLSLLERGAASAVGVDMAQGMIEKARELAREMGLDKRTRYVIGDFATTNGEIPDSDITILDKVVCCYEDVHTLVEKSTSKTKELYALTFPRDYLPVRTIFKTQIFISTLFGFSFRPYWHDWEEICKNIVANGFLEIYRNKTLTWTVRVYRRHHGR